MGSCSCYKIIIASPEACTRLGAPERYELVCLLRAKRAATGGSHYGSFSSLDKLLQGAKKKMELLKSQAAPPSLLMMAMAL